MLVLVLASIGAVASIVGLNAAHVAQAAPVSCSGHSPTGTTGNPHSADCTDDSRANHHGNAVGNPHNVDEGVTHGNPHPPEP
jgi:hypothetical protein